MLVGQATAVALLALRAHDSADPVAYVPGSGPGMWQPTPPLFKPALDAGWGAVTPFVLRSGSQFRPGAPPALTSATYTRDYLEIKAIGSATSALRTQDQTNIANMWTVTGVQMWNKTVQ